MTGTGQSVPRRRPMIKTMNFCVRNKAVVRMDLEHN
jgi:hypothetical protein